MLLEKSELMTRRTRTTTPVIVTLEISYLYLTKYSVLQSLYLSFGLSKPVSLVRCIYFVICPCFAILSQRFLYFVQRFVIFELLVVPVDCSIFHLISYYLHHFCSLSLCPHPLAYIVTFQKKLSAFVRQTILIEQHGKWNRFRSFLGMVRIVGLNLFFQHLPKTCQVCFITQFILIISAYALNLHQPE